jgi:hypothetical protein
MEESKYAVCMFYNAQFDIFNGLNETILDQKYTFLGFDRLESYTEIFEEELVFFSDLKTQFDLITTKQFKVKGLRPSTSTQKFATKYKDKKTLTTTDGVYAQPVWSQSLTENINDAIGADLTSMVDVSENLNLGASTGTTIINDFKSDNYVLVSSMSRAMDFVINKFKKLLNSSVSFDSSIDYVLNFFNSFRYFLIVLAILLFAAVPFFIYYYCVRTRNDDLVWLDKIMKLVNLFVNFMGYISGVLFLILVFVVTIQACFCFYLNEFIDKPDFYTNNKALFQIKDVEMSVILENCLDPNKATFSSIFNKPEETQTTTETNTDQQDAQNGANNPAPSGKFASNIKKWLMVR